MLIRSPIDPSLFLGPSVCRVVKFIPPGISQWENPVFYRVFPGWEKWALEVLVGKNWEIAKKQVSCSYFLINILFNSTGMLRYYLLSNEYKLNLIFKAGSSHKLMELTIKWFIVNFLDHKILQYRAYQVFNTSVSEQSFS